MPAGLCRGRNRESLPTGGAARRQHRPLARAAHHKRSMSERLLTADNLADIDAALLRGDAVGALCKMLRAAGARVTFDSGRNVTHPCTFCDTVDGPRQLVTIGTYPNGDDLTRPVCGACMPLVEARRSGAAPAPRVARLRRQNARLRDRVRRLRDELDLRDEFARIQLAELYGADDRARAAEEGERRWKAYYQKVMGQLVETEGRLIALQRERAAELRQARAGLLGALVQHVAAGPWVIERGGRRGARRREFKTEERARRAWENLDVREGWAKLLRPDGSVEARQSGPEGVRTRW